MNVKCRPEVQKYLQHSVGVKNMIVRKNLTKKSEKGGWIKQFSSSRSAPGGQKISLIHEEKHVFQKDSKIFQLSVLLSKLGFRDLKLKIDEEYLIYRSENIS